MESLQYEIKIDAPKAIVWNTLTDSEIYKQWVNAFSPNSYMEGEWKQGAQVKFLDPNMGGTKAIIDMLDPENYILARHISVISKEGEESTQGEVASNWVGTTEEYILNEENGITSLQIKIKSHSDFVEMFEVAWPKALSSIKVLSEARVESVG